MRGRIVIHQFQLVHHQVRGGLGLELNDPAMRLIFLKVMRQGVPQHDMAQFVKGGLVAVDRQRVEGKLCPLRPALEVAIGIVERHLSDAERIECSC